jgi:phosphoribosylformimino-5-aminoimidazole carboxamide ribotide isomerase
MIHLIPSISVINGKTIRLTKGDYSKETEYDISPIDIAKSFEDAGVRTIHLVDLEGAKKGSPVNYPTLETIANYTDLYINFSGGIHTDGDISKAYEYGATSITSATVAIRNKELFASWLLSYGREKIALGADALDGKIAIRGWQKGTGVNIMDHIEYFYNRNLKFLKTTDIARDGSLKGPSFELYKKIMKKFPGLSLFASGGVRSMDDIKKLDEMGVFGVIFGKAFYEERIKLKDIEKFLS